MSTNFYAVKIPSLKEHQEMEELLKTKMYNRLLDKITSSVTRYHIGKRSCGWQFLFCANDRDLAPWDSSKESLDEFISRPDIIIEDEYGDTYTPQEFWKEVGPWLYHDPEKYINGEDWDSKTQNRPQWLSKSEYASTDGLRWSRYADFT